MTTTKTGRLIADTEIRNVANANYKGQTFVDCSFHNLRTVSFMDCRFLDCRFDFHAHTHYYGCAFYNCTGQRNTTSAVRSSTVKLVQTHDMTFTYTHVITGGQITVHALSQVQADVRLFERLNHSWQEFQQYQRTGFTHTPPVEQVQSHRAGGTTV